MFLGRFRLDKGLKIPKISMKFSNLRLICGATFPVWGLLVLPACAQHKPHHPAAKKHYPATKSNQVGAKLNSVGAKKYQVVAKLDNVGAKSNAAAPVFTDKVGLDYRRSWIGNSFGTGGQPNGKWVQNNIVAMWVAPDGRCYTASSWDEGKRNAGIYADGKQLGQLADLHPNEGGAWGSGVSAIAGANDAVWISIGANVRRYKMEGGHWGFEGGVGRWKNEIQTTDAKGFLFGLSADSKGEKLFGALRGNGAAPAKDGKPATEKVPDEVVVVDLKTFKPLTKWNVPRVGRLAAAPDGTVWVTQEEDAENLAKIVRFDAEGKKLAGEIVGQKGFYPAALHFDKSGRLMVADNGPDQQIKIYDVSNAPKQIGTFGAKGGIFSGVAGRVEPLKFCGLTGVGTDANGNIYVSQNRFGPHVNGSEGAGSNIESYAPNGKRNWQVLGLEFVDGGDFVPGTDGAQIYSKYTRYELDLEKKELGSEWSYAAHTLNQFKYPNDPRFRRIRDHFDFSTTAFVRNLAGKRFLFNTGMWGWRFEVYRFNAATDGEIAIPSGTMSDGGGKNPVLGGENTWRDLNGNGNPEDEEFFGSGVPGKVHIKSWWIDDVGDMWQAAAYPGKVRRFPFGGLDKVGNPIWDYKTMEVFDAPAPFTGKGSAPYRIHYDNASDTLYLTGYTEAAPTHGGYDIKLIGRVMAAYPDWKKGNRKARWVNELFDGSGRANRDPASFRVAGDFVFVGYSGNASRPDSGFLRVFRASDGGHIGRIWAGDWASGRIDISHGVSAMKRKNGEYLVLVEEDWYARQMLYRWTPDARKIAAPLVTARAGNTVAALDWRVSEGTGAVAIERAEKPEGPFETLVPASESSSFSDAYRTNGQPYFYRVTASGVANSATSPVVSVTPSAKTPLRINAGGGPVGDWLGDLYHDGKYTDRTSATIDVSAPGAAPMDVYHSARVGAFTYKIPGQTVGQKVTVRLHFSEPNSGLVVHRKLNVQINGVEMLKNFGIGQEAGNKTHVAVVRDFADVLPNEKGEIEIKFGDAARFGASVCGIEILPQ